MSSANGRLLRGSSIAADPVADDLIAEAMAEEKAGQQFSHQPGRA